MNTTPPREFWNGNAVRVDDVWTLRKRNRVVQYMLSTHPLGWQLRLAVGELFMMEVCGWRLGLKKKPPLSLTKA